MRKLLTTTMILASLTAMPMVVGCDRTVSEQKKTTSSPNGATTTSEQKTVQHPDGSVTTEKQVNHDSGH